MSGRVVVLPRAGVPRPPSAWAAELADATERSVVLAGWGHPVLTALALAAERPGWLRALVVTPAAVGPGSAPLPRPLLTVVLGALPAPTLARLLRPERVGRWLDPVRTTDLRRLDLAAVAVPVLVPWGERDPANRAGCRRLVAAVPNGRLRPLPGAGPGWWDTAPALRQHVLDEALGLDG